MEGRKEVFYLTTHSTHFIYKLYGVGHMVKDHSDIERGNPLPPHRLSFRLAARVLLYAPSHIQDNTYHSLCYTSRGALAGKRNSSMGPPWGIDPMTHRTMSERSGVTRDAARCRVLVLKISCCLSETIACWQWAFSCITHVLFDNPPLSR